MGKSLRIFVGALCVCWGLNVSAQTTTNPTALPYYQYRGITDLGDAKAAWMTENPEAYRAYVAQSAAGVPAPAQTGVQVQEDVTRLPYYRFNGIEDLAEAKKAWLRANPQPAQRPVEATYPAPVQVETNPATLPYYNYNGIADIAAAKRAWLEDQQNAGLPWFNYNGIRDINAAKAAWFAANPDAHQQYQAAQSQGYIHRIPRTQFNAMPEAKQQHILQNLDRYQIVEDTPTQGATIPNRSGN